MDNPNNWIDPLGLWDLPSLPQGLVDFVVGFGDGIVTITTLGYGDLERTREALGCGGNVNMNTNEYLLTNTVGKMYGVVLPFAPKGLNLTGNTIKVAHYAPKGAEAWKGIIGQRIYVPK